MRKTTLFAAAMAALTSTVGIAQQPATRTFVHAGQTYVYTAANTGKSTVLTGRRMPGGETFRLQVQGNRVTGRSGDTPVSFRVSDARGAADGVTAHTL